MKTSWEYQLAIENNIPRYLKEYGSVIVQSPTGSGKSHMINKTVKRIIQANKIPLILSDSTKIHSQLMKECQGMRLDSAVKRATIIDGYAYVAMTQSLRNRDAIIEQFQKLRGKLVILVDECHRNTPTPVIEEIDPEWTIGFSATPHFRWAKHLPKLYASLIQGPQIRELIPAHLCHYKHAIRTGADLSALESKGKGGEYTEESQERVFGAKRMYDGIFDDLPTYQGRKAVVYVASINQCEDMYTKLQERGYRVCRYHSKLANAEYELSKFTVLHEADICVSVSSLTMGWDYPPIDLVILWRATTSLPLYLQMCGRGGRPCSAERALNEFNLPNYEKPQFTVLDYGGNYEQFGAWDMDRDWQEMWQDPKKRKVNTYAGVESSKLCPQCSAVLAVTARSCYNCGYIYPESEMLLIEGKLLEVKNTLNAMRNRKLSELNAEELAAYGKLNGKVQWATRIAKAKAQDNPEFLKDFGKHMGYDHRWATRQLEMLAGKSKIEFFDIVIS